MRAVMPPRARDADEGNPAPRQQSDRLDTLHAVDAYDYGIGGFAQNLDLFALTF